MRDWTKLKTQDWLTHRLAEEGPEFWTDTERRDLSDKLARQYRHASNRTWRVRRDQQMGERGSVQCTTLLVVNLKFTRMRTRRRPRPLPEVCRV
jgi:hypothetical protein